MKKAFNGFWYDGWFYAKFIYPLTRDEDRVVEQYIKDKTTAIDIGCGIGELAFSLSKKCKSVVGIDISPSMIKYAKEHNAAPNITYTLIQKEDRLSDVIEEKFDCAILKLVIHENFETERKQLIDDIRNICNEMIIVDIIAPQPISFSGQRTFILEFFAGRDHFKNFKHWHDNGGIDGFLERQGLTIQQAELSKNKIHKIAHVGW